MKVTRVWVKGDEERVFNGARVSVLQQEFQRWMVRVVTHSVNIPNATELKGG